MMQHSGPAGQTVGYARVSTTDQSLDRQVDALGDVDRLFTDQVTGSTRAGRDGLTRLIAYIRDGDTVRVTSMDRLARSVRDLRDVVDELTARGATVEFMHEGQIYRPGGADPMSDLMLNVLGAVAEFERALIRERQAEGIAAARKRGVYKGRRRALSDDDVACARRRPQGTDRPRPGRRPLHALPGVERLKLLEWVCFHVMYIRHPSVLCRASRTSASPSPSASISHTSNPAPHHAGPPYPSDRLLKES